MLIFMRDSSDMLALSVMQAQNYMLVLIFMWASSDMLALSVMLARNVIHDKQELVAMPKTRSRLHTLLDTVNAHY